MALVSYMGTKESFAADIARSFEALPSGPLLDLFSGMSAVGRATAPTRNIWVNDVQRFSQLFSEFQFLPESVPASFAANLRSVLRSYRDQHALLEAEFEESLARESAALSSASMHALIEYESHVRDCFNPSSFRADAQGVISQASYRLFSDLYASTYFGLRQCIEIDALRYGIDVAAPASDPMLAGLRRWMLASLGAAVSRCSNSTGHFAQFLTASETNAGRVASKRRRSIKADWMLRLRTAAQVGTPKWRKRNKVFALDACDLLLKLRRTRSRPGVIYADPPYTSDQYSRYYHILDTMILYDFPSVTGKGRYRPGRFVSDWSLITKVQSSFENLVEYAADLGSSLVISYPEDGLLKGSERAIPEMMRNRFQSVSRLTPVAHHHSTMGGSKGQQRTPVAEQIFVASGCKSA